MRCIDDQALQASVKYGTSTESKEEQMIYRRECALKIESSREIIDGREKGFGFSEARAA